MAISSKLSLHRLIYLLFFLAIALLAVDLLNFFLKLVPFHSLRDWIDITREANLPTVLSSGLAMAAALAAYLNRLQTRDQPGLSRVWLSMALLLLFIGLDDASQIHERLGTWFGHLAGRYAGDPWWNRLHHFKSYYWLVTVGPVFALAGILTGGLLLRDFGPSLPLLLFLAGMGCYAEAMALDYLDGRWDYAEAMALTGLSHGHLEHLVRAVEEFIEMLGPISLLGAFLEQARRRSLRQGDDELLFTLKLTA
ncbi:MAG: hypothetical protein HQL56_06175 [Magnetococcales bacterium]|nr:hypothetical protein [Magnetococcales bacterium]